MPFSVPVATVKFNTSIKATTVIPPTKLATRIANNIEGQLFGHLMQRELPRDRLSPGWHFPHEVPEQLNCIVH